MRISDKINHVGKNEKRRQITDKLQTKTQWRKSVNGKKKRGVAIIPEAMAEVLYPLMISWKIYSIMANITGKHRAVPGGRWVLRWGIEIPCIYSVCMDSQHLRWMDFNARACKCTHKHIHHSHIHLPLSIGNQYLQWWIPISKTTIPPHITLEWYFILQIFWSSQRI